jgi:hypothetical protein
MAKLLAKRKKHALGTGKAQAAGQQSGGIGYTPEKHLINHRLNS